MTDIQGDNGQLIAKIEALLFVYGEAMATDRIAKICDKSEEAVTGALLALGESMKADARGLMLVNFKNRYQIVTKSIFSDLLQTIIKEEFSENLTPAALETLTIVAYAGPITRAEIDYIRGVNSSFIMRALMIRGMVEKVIDEKRGNAFLYGPSFELLKRLGFSKASELPEFEHFSNLLKKMNQTDGSNESKQDHGQ